MRALSPQRAFDKATANVHPELLALYEKALAEMRLPKRGEKAEAIVCSPWPIPEPGVMRAVCAKCGCYVALSPDSGIPWHARWPDIPLLCRDCAVEEAAKRRAPENSLGNL